MILQTVTFVNNDIGELGETFQFGLITNSNFVRGHNEGEIFLPAKLVMQGALEHGFSLGRGTVVANDGVIGHPLFEFSHPIGQRG